MRPSGAVLVGFAALVGLPASGRGDRPARSPDEVDVTKVKPDLAVVHDGHGHYLALVPMRDMDMTFYGDGKVFRQLRVTNRSSNGKAVTSSRRFWSPISTDADIVLAAGGKWTVHCSDRRTPMMTLGPAETREMLARARFERPFWKRQAHALARDERGSYYYVDKIRDDRPLTERQRDANPPRGYRLYVGRKGRMKAQKLTDAVVDSKGIVLSVKGGDLSFDFDGRTAVYATDRARNQLVYLPVEDNAMLIYRDLGLYQKLGIPCDDM